MRTVLENIISVIGGEAAVRVANFVAALFIARAYGGYVLGAYAACLAVVTIFVMFADNGLQTFAITELSGRPSAQNQIVGRVYIYKTILFAAVLLILTAVTGCLKLAPFVLAIGLWVTVRTLLQSYSQLQMAIIKALSKARAIGVIQVVHSIFLLIGVALTYRRHWTLFTLLAWLTGGQLLEFVMTILVLRRSGVRPSWPDHLLFWSAMRKATPFGITYGLANLIVRADTAVLSALVPLTVLGTFSAANSILLIVYVAAWLLGTILLPEMVRVSVSAEALKLYVRKWTRLLAFTSVPCAVLVFLVAPEIMPFLFGQSFYRSGALASVMALACPFIVLNAVFTNFAIAMNRKSVFTGLFAAATIFTITLDILLGLAFGSMGIAIAIVIREMGMLAGFWILLSRAQVPAAQLSCPLSS